jgi:hypothetical protein
MAHSADAVLLQQELVAKACGDAYDGGASSSDGVFGGTKETGYGAEARIKRAKRRGTTSGRRHLLPTKFRGLIFLPPQPRHLSSQGRKSE